MKHAQRPIGSNNDARSEPLTKALLVDAFGPDVGVELYHNWYGSTYFNEHGIVAYDLMGYLYRSSSLSKFSEEIDAGKPTKSELEFLPMPNGPYTIRGEPSKRFWLVASAIVNVGIVGFMEDEDRQTLAIDAVRAVNVPEMWMLPENPVFMLGGLAAALNGLNSYAEIINADLWEEIFEPVISAIKESPRKGIECLSEIGRILWQGLGRAGPLVSESPDIAVRHLREIKVGIDSINAEFLRA